MTRSPDAGSSARLVLWDVDHTLIENGGVSKATYAGAFALLTGRAPVVAADTEGRTDAAIMRALVEAHGLGWSFEESYEAALARSLSQREGQLRRRGSVLPGALAALRDLAGREGVFQSVLTGNVRRNAETKLATFGLASLIDFELGAYGADGLDRAALVPMAQARARAHTEIVFGRESTVLIGDTPRDVAAGIEGGARVIGVATGLYSVHELEVAGADAVLPDLTDTARVLAAVAGIAPVLDGGGKIPAAEVEGLLVPLGDRWLHTRSVAARAWELAVAVPPSDRELLVQAALLHDVGYAPALVDSGLHSLDGARWLRGRGAPARLCSLVAYHSGALVEARHRGLNGDLRREFEQETSPVADALTCADMTTGPQGQLVDVRDRLAEILHRYPTEHVVRQAVNESSPELICAVERTLGRLPAR